MLVLPYHDYSLVISSKDVVLVACIVCNYAVAVYHKVLSVAIQCI